jgi:hypothetical protein
MNGFVTLAQELLHERKVPFPNIYREHHVKPRGLNRPRKKWDLLVVAAGRLQAGVEFESRVGSRQSGWIEEATGSATDIWTAYRYEAFEPWRAPWLGYLMMLEDAPERATSVERHETLLTKVVRDRIYNGACPLLSNRNDGKRGMYREPSPELSFQNFINSLLARVAVGP